MKRLVREEKFKIPDYIFIALSILNIGIFVFSSDIFGNIGLFSLFARMLIIVNVAVLLLGFLKQSSSHAVKQYITIFFMFLFGVLSYLICRPISLFDFVVLFAGYLAVPVYAVSVPKLKFNSNLIVWFRLISVVYAFYFIYRGFFTPTYREGTGALLMGYINSNTTGAYMFLVSLFVLLSFNNAAKRIWRIFSYLIVTLLLYLIIQTQCRTAFILTSVCLIYAVLPKIYRPGKIFAAISVVSSFLFYYIYIYLYQMRWNIDLTILDKTVYSGRQEIFLEYGIKYTVFGNFEELFSGLNVSVGVVNTLGIVGFIAFLVFYINFLSSPVMQNYKGKRRERRNLPLLCFCAIMIHGCVETVLFTGGSVFAGVIGCIIAVIICNNQDVQQKQIKR